MNYIETFHKEYLLQQGLEYTPENVKDFSVDPSTLMLIYEEYGFWIVLCYGDDSRRILYVTYKDGYRRMECMEL